MPKPRIHKRGYQRIRIGNRDFALGKPGNRQADERYKTILAAWAEGGGRLPDDFQLESEPAKTKSFKPKQHIPVLNQICVADLLCTAFADVEEKSWHWYLLRRVAVCLKPYANLPAVEIRPRLLGQVAKTIVIAPMQATRNGENRRTVLRYGIELTPVGPPISSKLVSKELNK